jgi:hypothetical protein
MGETLGFEQLVREEEQDILARREHLKLPPRTRYTGLALSGGGIRSATFCLGFLQSLSTRGLMPEIDYISTVSGGSYIGAFFGALFVPSERRGDRKPHGGRKKIDPKNPLGCPLGLAAVRRLRDCGRYLTPAGTSDAFFGAAVVMRNWAAVQFVIGITALLGFWLLRILDHNIVPPFANWKKEISYPLLILVFLSLAAFLACGSAYWLTRREAIPTKRFWRGVLNLFFWAFLMLCAYVLSPWWGPGWLEPVVPPKGVMSGFVALVAGLAILVYFWAEARAGAVAFSADNVRSESQDIQAQHDLARAQQLITAEDLITPRTLPFDKAMSNLFNAAR